MRSRRITVDTLLALSGPFLLLATGVVLFPSAGRDDVYISYWAAQMLRDHGQILTYAGQLAEQSSSLLHVLILASVSTLSGLDMPAIGTPLSILFGMLAVREAGLLVRQLGIDLGGAAMWAAAVCTPLVYWSFGALETTLVAFLLAAFLRQLLVFLGSATPSTRGTTLCVLLGIAYLLARPEAVFVQQSFLLAAIVVYWSQPWARRRLVLLTTTLLFAFGLLALWRLQNFGQIFPLPVSAKVHLNLPGMLSDGWWYLDHSWRQVPLLILLLAVVAGLGVWQLCRQGFENRPVLLCLLLAGAQCAFVVASGGDWMEGGRFFVPAIPILVAVATHALGNRPASVRSTVLAAFVLASLAQSLWFARHHSTGIPLHQMHKYRDWAATRGIDIARFGFFDSSNRVHLRDALFIPRVEAEIEAALRDRDQLVMMSAQAGMVPYYVLQKYAAQVRFVDMAGLSSTEFVNCRSVLEQNPSQASSRGIGITDEYYLQHYAGFRACNIPPADLYFNIDTQRGGKAAALSQSGHFQLLHQQADNICAKKTWCPRTLVGHMMLARATEISGTGTD